MAWSLVTQHYCECGYRSKAFFDVHDAIASVDWDWMEFATPKALNNTPYKDDLYHCNFSCPLCGQRLKSYFGWNDFVTTKVKINSNIDDRPIIRKAIKEMKPMKDYNEIPETTDREKLLAGGYVLKIIDAIDKPDKEYFEIIYDIAEGKEKGRYSDEWGTEHPYAHRFFRSYSDKAKGMFKAFISAVEKSSNCELAPKVIDGTLSSSDLKGKLVGAIINYEEYQTDRGEVKTRTYIHSVMSAERVRNLDYTIPPIKGLKDGKSADSATNSMQQNNSATPGFTPIVDEDLPF